MGIANDYTPDIDDLASPTIAHAAFRMADEVRLLKTRAKSNLAAINNQVSTITAIKDEAQASAAASADSASASAASAASSANYADSSAFYAANAQASAANSAASAADSSVYATDALNSYAQTEAIASAFAGAVVGFDANAYDFGSVVDQTTYFNRDFGVL